MQHQKLRHLLHINVYSVNKDFCGMTGTVKTERREFRKIYKKKISVIPTNRPVIRQDLPDRIFARKEEKYQAILEETRKAIDKGRAVLVGTASVLTSEELSDIFDVNSIFEFIESSDIAKETAIFLRSFSSEKTEWCSVLPLLKSESSLSRLHINSISSIA